MNCCWFIIKLRYDGAYLHLKKMVGKAKFSDKSEVVLKRKRKFEKFKFKLT